MYIYDNVKLVILIEIKKDSFPTKIISYKLFQCQCFREPYD